MRVQPAITIKIINEIYLVKSCRSHPFKLFAINDLRLFIGVTFDKIPLGNTLFFPKINQVYHSNAVTNIHIRRQIKESSLTNFQLAQTFHTSPATISKWKNRETCEDKSSRPHQIVYALNELEESLVVSIRKTTWLPLDEVWEMLFVYNPQM